MVEDNDVNAEIPRIGDLFCVTDTSINGEEEGDTFCMQGINKFFFDSVSVFLTMGEDHRGFHSLSPKKSEELGGSGNAVCIVITDDADILSRPGTAALTLLKRKARPLYRSLHLAKRQRVTQTFPGDLCMQINAACLCENLHNTSFP